jgi:two-component system, chemotaxis family, chemotaxis protein CheY
VRVLIVEDSRAMRAIIKRLFMFLGAEDPAEAGNGQEAIDLLAEGAQFDLILIDWNMPRVNGFDLIKFIRKDDSYANTKLMMATTETEINRVAQALEAGADEYIMKPFTKDILGEKLKLLGLIND